METPISTDAVAVMLGMLGSSTFSLVPVACGGQAS
jgi:hypothetical protein